MTGRDHEDAALREAVAFSLMRAVRGSAFRAGVERYGSAAEAFHGHGTAGGRQAALDAADDVIGASRAAGAAIVVMGDEGYPASLLDLPLPPRLLFMSGDPHLAGRRRVGIVGTRHSSPGGERIAREMAALLAGHGVVVVSGMALGIDAAAHRGALDAGGGTIAVLGSGVDVPYPPRHRALHARIVSDGLVVSEAPIGSHPVPGAFPRRNRIIAALSETLVVIEAGDHSGALITSRLALDLGRNVAAVPGPIDSPRHVGTNRLLSEGAAFISKVEDVLSIAGIETGTSTSAPIVACDVADDASHVAILNAVRAGASDLEDVARSARLSPRELATALSTLEMAGKLIVTPAGGVAIVG